jgi:hypothetical protein
LTSERVPDRIELSVDEQEHLYVLLRRHDESLGEVLEEVRNRLECSLYRFKSIAEMELLEQRIAADRTRRT